jgi:hypothetical protein
LPSFSACDLAAAALDDELALQTARDWDAPSETLARVAARGENPWLVDVALAKNPGTPASALNELAGSQLSEVRQAAAAHPSISSATLSRLAADRLRDIRATVASHPRTETADLVRLAADPDLQVVLQVIARPRLAPEVTAVLRRSRYLVVHEHLDKRELVAA